MNYDVEIMEMVDVPEATFAALDHAVKVALATAGAGDDAGVAVVLADDNYLQGLNYQFRGEDHATDVLSFPAGEAIPGPEGDFGFLGDIAISVPFAQRQASAQGHQLLEELQLLAVHGVLHLVGYDHATPEDKAEMWRQQQNILEALGLTHVQPTEDDHEL